MTTARGVRKHRTTDPKALLASIATSKYYAQPTFVDGHRFASKKEATRYGELWLLEKAGRISQLELQPRYELKVNGIKVATYAADFRYREALNGVASVVVVVEDVKSGPTKTEAYRLKKKLMLACWGIEIRET